MNNFAKKETFIDEAYNAPNKPKPGDKTYKSRSFNNFVENEDPVMRRSRGRLFRCGARESVPSYQNGFCNQYVNTSATLLTSSKNR